MLTSSAAKRNKQLMLTRHSPVRGLTAAVLTLLLASDGHAAGVQGRTQSAASRVTPPAENVENARDTRERLRELLDEYPPTVAQVLRLDPALLARPDYLSTYPKLATFFAQHPEVAHNPVFFLGDSGYREVYSRLSVPGLMQSVLAGIAGLIIFSTVVGLIVWILRSLINYRSWLRVTKIQTDAHTKIFDRLGSNEELMAYIQSPAGQRFLTSASLTVDVLPRSVGAPVGRILWSMQAGVVVTLAGAGLWVAKASVAEEVAQLLHVVAVLAVAIGLGFVVSAALAYALSHRLGLLDPAARASHG
jgi:hypothetical protein